MKFRFALAFIATVLILTSFWVGRESKKTMGKVNTTESVTVNMRFAIRESHNERLIENARIVIIGNDGEVIDVIVSNKEGLADKEITIPSDMKYLDKKLTDFEGGRGSATVIVYKEGFRETILYNVGVGENSSYQLVYIKPVVEGNRNEPDEQVGYSHHLDTCRLAEKYAEYAGKKVEY